MAIKRSDEGLRPHKSLLGGSRIIWVLVLLVYALVDASAQLDAYCASLLGQCPAETLQKESSFLRAKSDIVRTTDRRTKISPTTIYYLRTITS